MNRFLNLDNILRFRRLASNATTEEERKILLAGLSQQKLDMHGDYRRLIALRARFSTRP